MISPTRFRWTLLLLSGIQQIASQAINMDITDATSEFKASTESDFDHMVQLQDNLAFHWNDPFLTSSPDNPSLQGRLVHRADSMAQAPGWLAFSLYGENMNYDSLPIANVLAGSSAVVGNVLQVNSESIAETVRLGQESWVQEVEPNSETGFQNAKIAQHDRDSGLVTTSLSFTLEKGLRMQGANVLMWAVGPPGGSGAQEHHGMFYLDFKSVRQQVEGGTSQQPDGNQEGASPGVVNTPKVNTAPVIRGECGSTLFSGDGAGQIALTPFLNFHWNLKKGRIQLGLESTNQRETWLGLGVSPDGYMVGSTAVIASPGNDNQGIAPQHFSLTDQDSAGVQPLQGPSLMDASIQSTLGNGYTTTLQYSKTLNDPNDPNPIVAAGLTTFVYAIGSSRQLGYHEHRGAFQINLEECGGSRTTVKGTAKTAGGIWSNSSTFAAHGFLAILAFGLATPFAVTVAWFRTLVPSSWIYIHVLANMFTFLATFAAFCLAVRGISTEDGADHFSKMHHWVGTALFLLVVFQTLNGFLRPPVERKDQNRTLMQGTHRDTFFGFVPVPQTQREAWQLMHRVTGLGLYASRFGTSSMVRYYWIYVALFFVGIIGLKGWVLAEEDKARQGVLNVVEKVRL